MLVSVVVLLVGCLDLKGMKEGRKEGRTKANNNKKGQLSARRPRGGGGGGAAGGGGGMSKPG